jgi:ABC-type bacteriocin/lantibiotic exporter with double-glycine peptidase domain
MIRRVYTGLSVPIDAAMLLAELANEKGLPTAALNEALAYERDSVSLSIERIIGMAKLSCGDVHALKLKPEDIYLLDSFLPLVVPDRKGSACIFLGVARSGNDETELPSKFHFAQRNGDTGEIETIEETAEDIESWWPDYVLHVEKESVQSNQEKFGIGWFFSQIGARPGLLGALLLTITVVHIVGLAIPLFFQAVVDKVLVHETLGTLKALTIGVLIVITCEAFLKFFREYMISHLAAKIDILTATITFRHLVNLPLAFFGKNTAGVITNNMHQADEIREFVTGRFLGSAIQVTALVVFLPVLFIYSVNLTFIVIGAGTLMSVIVGLLIKPYFKTLLGLYEVEGQRKTLMVETIHGITTVKSLALEQERMKDWTKYSIQW